MSAPPSPDIALLLRQDARRWRALGLVAALDLPGGCIGAGFVRNLVWDHLHKRASDCRATDVDVLYFDRAETRATRDAGIEARLRAAAPDLRWSVKNQARMHLRNGDLPYASVAQAMRHWPETATAVAAWRRDEDCLILAPFGVVDLVGMVLRPTSAAKRRAFETRLASKRWLSRWPRLRVEDT
jgi:uncharacterized protein